mgnify:CR=1 FL=1
MTCIVGVQNGGTVWIGGDSAATDGHLNRTIISDPKVFVKDGFAFGVCGSPKVLDAIAHIIDLPEQEGTNDRAFLVGIVVPAIREGLKQLDATVQAMTGETCFEGEMLVGYRGKLYTLESNFQLIAAASGTAAIGSGGSIATGSLQATRGKSPKRRILKALEAATEGNAGVAPPFVIVSVKK